MQVVIAEHGDRAVAERDQFAQRRERAGTAVDDVAGEPQWRVVRWRGFREQAPEFVMAALQIAEGEGSGPRGSGHVECVGERPGSDKTTGGTIVRASASTAQYRVT